MTRTVTPEERAEACWHEGGREVIAAAIREAEGQATAAERERLLAVAEGAIGFMTPGSGAEFGAHIVLNALRAPIRAQPTSPSGKGGGQ